MPSKPLIIAVSLSIECFDFFKLIPSVLLQSHWTSIINNNNTINVLHFSIIQKVTLEPGKPCPGGPCGPGGPIGPWIPFRIKVLNVISEIKIFWGTPCVFWSEGIALHYKLLTPHQLLTGPLEASEQSPLFRSQCIAFPSRMGREMTVGSREYLE